jgi:hypothetical protein
MDQLSLRLLKMQTGRCPCCGDLLLYAEHLPQTPIEWEQWVRVTGKALRKQANAYGKATGWARPATSVSYTPDLAAAKPPQRLSTSVLLARAQ